MPRDPAEMAPGEILSEIQSMTRPRVDAVREELARHHREKPIRTARKLERQLREAVEANPGHPDLLRLTAAHDAAERAVAALRGVRTAGRTA